MQEPTSEYLELCRAAMLKEQSLSLEQTNNWAHVDRQQVHADWANLYKELAPLIDSSAARAPTVQALIARHYSIASRFYIPSREAYIGMSLFYAENEGMRDFHNGFHPEMVEFLAHGMFEYAQAKL
ncbi:TipAS antibiotic-recognition domain-containing protein [Roseateles albus]|uniref:TipAS antibiotic-recognition domain-containing protein n=1 Tax=Roseateles albus TaxID=2987525 RepID=A0ABT5KJM0_9BURK|nr:TipAS antibiotic-recognition domain-containing protein [Roseateles albus]MDC8774128.1 TipAS antibiotic-recognition domain-containing protein [Roseateles albus]